MLTVNTREGEAIADAYGELVSGEKSYALEPSDSGGLVASVTDPASTVKLIAHAPGFRSGHRIVENWRQRLEKTDSGAYVLPDIRLSASITATIGLDMSAATGQLLRDIGTKRFLVDVRGRSDSVFRTQPVASAELHIASNKPRVTVDLPRRGAWIAGIGLIRSGSPNVAMSLTRSGIDLQELARGEYHASLTIEEDQLVTGWLEYGDLTRAPWGKIIYRQHGDTTWFSSRASSAGEFFIFAQNPGVGVDIRSNATSDDPIVIVNSGERRRGIAVPIAMNKPLRVRLVNSEGHPIEKYTLSRSHRHERGYDSIRPRSHPGGIAALPIKEIPAGQRWFVYTLDGERHIQFGSRVTAKDSEIASIGVAEPVARVNLQIFPDDDIAPLTSLRLTELSPPHASKARIYRGFRPETRDTPWVIRGIAVGSYSYRIFDGVRRTERTVDVTLDGPQSLRLGWD